VAYLDADAGSAIAFTEIWWTTNRDKLQQPEWTLTRTGTWLPDTTVIFAWDSFAQRHEATSWMLTSSYPSYMGNKLGKTQVLSVYAKISNANYYAWTYWKPKIRVTYDWGLHYVETEMALNTDVQRLQVSFVPTTSVWVVTVSMTSETDATGTDSYVYFWHFEWNIPNVWNMNLWYIAEPVLDMGLAETNATALASSVRNYASASATTTWSMGVFIKKLLTVAKFLWLK
jgi:hypothetical protein